VDGDASDLSLLLASARHEVGALRHDPRLGPLGPGSRGAALRSHVLDLIGAVEHRMAQAPPATAPEPERRAFARSLRQSIIVLRGAHAALPWLEATRAPTVNMGSLYVTEDCARVLVGSDVDLVVVPDPEFMYSTTSWMFSAVINSTPGFVASTTRRPIVLNYPLSDSDRLLLHPIFGHELGHAAVDEHHLVADVETTLDGDPGFVAAFNQAVADMQSIWTAAGPTQIAGTMRAWLRQWIEELLCDHLAVEAMGPAFLWAFASFVMPLSYGAPAQSHPPNTLRTRLLVSQLTERGWRGYLDRVAPGVMAWLDGIAADATSALALPYSFLRDQLLAHGQVLRDTASARAGVGSLALSDAERDANEAADLLRETILPNGIGDPMDGRSILLGGWQYALEAHGDNPEGLVAALTDWQLQELTGKAIEMSVISRTWEAGT
jgi:hypothetical protein